jgi:23S rRNA (guanosine2251-2'-O)-methyltransferase
LIIERVKGLRNNSKKSSPLSEEDIIEGRNPCMEAIKAGRTINKLLVSKGAKEGSINKIIRMAKENKIVIQEVDKEKLDGLSQTQQHQGIIAVVSLKDYVEVEDILERANALKQTPFLVVLDEIQDVYNLGAVLRTADAVGAHGVIIPKRRSASLNSVVAKASAGAIEYVPVARVANIPSTIDKLKKEGLWVVGLDANGEKLYNQADLKGPIALVIGSEGEGIGRLVKEKCDFLVNLPMKGNVSSLNASVATGIVMYEVLKQRNNG